MAIKCKYRERYKTTEYAGLNPVWPPKNYGLVVQRQDVPHKDNNRQADIGKDIDVIIQQNKGRLSQAREPPHYSRGRGSYHGRGILDFVKKSGKRSESTGKEKNFWSYLSVMADLRISRRTLQRWIDDLDIEPLEFEDHLRVFLLLSDVAKLRDYCAVMATRDQVLINRYRQAYATGNTSKMARIRRELA